MVCHLNSWLERCVDLVSGQRGTEYSVPVYGAGLMIIIIIYLNDRSASSERHMLQRGTYLPASTSLVSRCILVPGTCAKSPNRDC